jgi:hypothetical protein
MEVGMARSLSLRILSLLLLLSILAAGGCRRSSSGHRKWKVGGGKDVVDPGDPVLDAAAGFVGSTICGDCHGEIFDTWSETYHNVSMRTTEREGATGEAVVADADGNGTDDFQDGLDLATDPDFAAYGANAPKLSVVSGDDFPYKVTIGAITYDVWRTMGGNGPWRQRYLTRIGLAEHLLPVQYNEQAANWVPINPGDWYDAGGAPLFDDASTVADEIDPATSFEIRCAGCHTTGLDVALDPSGQYVAGYINLTIGCEICHGPGADHVAAAGDPALILNPADLLDGTTEGVLAADLTCGQCHIRGEGGVVIGGTDHTYFPWNGASTFPVGGTNLDDYFTETTTDDDFWRRKDNPTGFVPTPADPSDDTFLTARNAEMQFIDLQNGPHGPDNSFDPVCFSCHDPHARNQRHQIRETLVIRGVTYTGVSQDNNKLCLACHHGGGDFADITDADVEAITDDTAPASVVTGVSDHMKNQAAMPIDPANYDPVGTGTGRCTTCHMVLTSLSAEYGQDAAGLNEGDLHSHTFQVMWPNISKITDIPITNSCNVCHPTEVDDRAAVVIEEWTSDPDADGTSHADTPRNFQNGVANHERDGGVACVACHTTEGFVRIQVNGDIHDLTADTDAGARDSLIANAIKRDKGITCQACHGKQADGTFAAGPNPLRFPKAELCGRCHNNETVLEEDWVDTGEIVRHPQAQMFEGVDGGEVAGESYGNSTHTALMADKCVTCHYFDDGGGANHDFMPTLASCQPCHAGLDTFDRTARADYDGDGTVEGIQTETDGCLEILKAGILATPASTGVPITYDDPYFLIDGSNSNTAALDETADAALMRAIFDYYWVSFDASRGIHNTQYALQLIQNVYVEMTGNAWPGVVR